MMGGMPETGIAGSRPGRLGLPRFGLPWPLGPVAHRGLHDGARGVVENTPSAFAAAITAGYAIETDIQASADMPVAFHDETLERLTDGSGAVAGLSARALQAIAFRQTADRMLTLPELLDLVGGRVPLYLEVKTTNGNAGTLSEKVAGLIASYRGPLAVMSFDPLAVRAMRRLAPSVPRGLVSMRFTASEWPDMSAAARFRLTHMLDFPSAAPNFLAYYVDDLPRPGIALLRRLGMPVLAWTVRDAGQLRRAAVHADAAIFEEIRP